MAQDAPYNGPFRPTPPHSSGSRARDSETSTAANLAGAASRLNAQLMASATQTPSPSRRIRGQPSSTHRYLPDILPIVESSNSPPPSDVASNLSGATNQSNGATFFRTYQDGVIPPRNGILTPDLNFAEIGHGRGSQSTSQHPLRRGQELAPQSRANPGENDYSSSRRGRKPHPGTSLVESPGVYAVPATRSEHVIPWPYRESESPSTSSLPSAGKDAPEASQIESGRGRSVKRSLRNTLNAAEQYASSFFGRSPTRGTSEDN